MIIGIGCDITKISRFTNLKENTLKKILTPKELEIYYQRKDYKRIEFLAGHFSAKESIIKALYHEKKLNMSEIEILYDNEKPSCKIDNYQILISISHDGEYALSYVTILK